MGRLIKAELPPGRSAEDRQTNGEHPELDDDASKALFSWHLQRRGRRLFQPAPPRAEDIRAAVANQVHRQAASAERRPRASQQARSTPQPRAC